MTKANDKPLFLLNFFLANFSHNLFVMALVSHGALNLGGLGAAATIVAYQALGAIMALTLGMLVRFGEPRQRALLISGLVICSSMLLSVFPEQSNIWYMLVLLRSCFGIWLFSLLFALVPNLDLSNPLAFNKKAQLTRTLSLVFGYSCGPLLISLVGLNGVLAIDWAANTIGLFILLMISKNVFDSSLDIDKASSFGMSGISKSWAIQALTAFVWILGGVFHVVEIPFLSKELNLSSEMISGVLFLGMIGHVVGVAFSKVKTFDQSFWTTTGLFTIALCFLPFLYLKAQTPEWIIATVFAYGFFNGSFNLFQTSYLQNIDNVRLRENAFIGLKLMMQVALLLGVFISTAGSYSKIADILFATGILFSICSIAIIFLKIKHFRHTLASFFFLLLFLPKFSQATHSNLIVQIPDLPKSLAPYKIQTVGEALVLRQIFENLYAHDESGQITPVLAKNQRWKNKLMALELTLADRRFSNGDVITSEIVVSSLKNAIKESKDALGWAFSNISGFEEYIQNPSDKNLNTIGIREIDNKKVEFSFKRPMSHFLETLASPYLSIALKHNNLYLGTGKYILDTKNETSWTLKRVDKNPQKIIFQNLYPKLNSLSDPSSPDLILPAPSQLGDEYISRHTPQLKLIVLFLNTKSRTFSTSDSRCDFLSNFENVTKESTYKWTPVELGLPITWGMMKKGKRPTLNSSVTKNIEILFANSAARFDQFTNTKIATSLSQIGYNVTFQEMPIADLVKKARQGSFQALLIGWVPDYLNADAVLYPMLASKQQYNFSQFENPIVDQKLKQIRASINKSQQVQYYRDIFKIIHELCPVSFLGTQPGIIAYKRTLEVPIINQIGWHTLDLSKVSYKRSSK